MDGRSSEISKKIADKYGKTVIGKVYEIDGKFYKLTDGNLSSLYKKIEVLKKKLKDGK